MNTPTKKSIASMPLTTLYDAAKKDNVNDALILIQDAIGQPDGGVASIYFSGNTTIEDGNILEWKQADQAGRVAILSEYLSFEIKYVGVGAMDSFEKWKASREVLTLPEFFIIDEEAYNHITNDDEEVGDNIAKVINVVSYACGYIEEVQIPNPRNCKRYVLNLENISEDADTLEELEPILWKWVNPHATV